MNVDVEPSAPKAGASPSQAARTYEAVTGQGALTWATLALLNFTAQAVLFGEMWGRAGNHPGEFGILNAALGIVGLLAVPAVALSLAFRLFFARARSTSLDSLRDASATIIETFAWGCGACCFVLLLLPLPLPALPRFTLVLFTLLNTLLALGAIVSGAVSTDPRDARRWALLLIAAAALRVVLGAWFTAYQPWAEAALAAFVIAGFVTLSPALRPRDVPLAARFRACAATLDASFLRFFTATLSVLLGIYLFTNADRIVALRWLNILIGDSSIPSAPLQRIFDVYQATGLLARGLLWGTQPLLWLLYAERSRLDKTTPASLKFLWIYLAALLIGAVVLGYLTHKGGPIDALIPGAGGIGPTFAAVMIPLGLLQCLGVFALASRRQPECYLVGACGIVYALVLDFVGRRPETILPYMFGSSIVALMVILFVGVVRWGRKQP